MKVVAYPKKAEVNPYNSLLYSAVEPLGVEVVEFDPLACPQQADVLHIHWPEGFLSRRNPLRVAAEMKRWLRCLAAYRAQGTRIVWTAHNVRQHEGRHKTIEEAFWRRFLPLVDGVVCLSEASWIELKRMRPTVTECHAIVPHGHYRDVYPNTVGRTASRKALGVKDDSAVLVSVGLIRPYKNIPALIRAFRAHRGDDRLLVAGDCFDADLATKVRSLASQDERVTLHLRNVSDNALQAYFAGADLAVMPFTSILNSGSALMALSFDVPILVPSIGSMPELQTQVGKDWVMTYDGEFGLDVLEAAIVWTKKTSRGNHAPLQLFDWPAIGEKTVAFYREVLAK